MICLHVLYSQCVRVCQQNTNNLESLSFKQLSICVCVCMLFLWGEDASLEFGWFHKRACMEAQLAKDARLRTGAWRAALEEDDLRAGCYQQDSSHTHIPSQTHGGSKDFIPVCR